MEDSFYKDIIAQSPIAYSYHRIILNKEGLPCDYEFLEINKKFEELAGLPARDIVGKRLTELASEIRTGDFDCVAAFGEVAISEKNLVYEEYFPLLKGYFRMHAHSLKKDYFMICYCNITKEKMHLLELEKLQSYSEELLKMRPCNMDYQKILNNIMNISRSKYGLLLLYDESRDRFSVAALSGDKEKMQEGSRIFGFVQVEKGWSHKSAESQKGWERIQVHFSELHRIIGRSIPHPLITQVIECLDSDELTVMRILCEGRILGDIVLIMQRGMQAENLNLIEIYSRQIGMFLIRNKAEEQLLQNEDKLVASEQRLRSMIANISDVILIVDENAVVKYSSPNMEERYGWTEEDFKDVPSWEVFHPDCRELLQEEFVAILKTDGIKKTMEARYLCKDGSYRDIEITGVNLKKDPNIQGLLLTYHDITERKKQEAKLLYMGYHDPLTGLYNRAFFEEETSRLDTKRQLPLSVVIGDINGLKLINDVIGHAEGDSLLRKIAGILKKCCRKEDILARTGGDEFGILLPKMSMENTKRMVDRLYAACEEDKDENSLYTASISLGYATKTEETESIDDKIRLASEHMSKRKLLERKSLHNSILSSFKATMIEKSQHTEEHAERLIRLSRKLGMEMKLTDEQLDELELLSTLHDIGKISIDESILNKKEKLTEDEWSLIRKHPEVGYRIAMSSLELMPIAEYIMCHHERWDGKGYPQGIAGDDIPLLSRIVAVTDAYDAMTNERPYRKPISKKEAVHEILSNAGTQFDPTVARLFARLLSRKKDK